MLAMLRRKSPSPNRSSPSPHLRPTPGDWLSSPQLSPTPPNSFGANDWDLHMLVDEIAHDTSLEEVEYVRKLHYSNN